MKVVVVVVVMMMIVTRADVLLHRKHSPKQTTGKRCGAWRILKRRQVMLAII